MIAASPDMLPNDVDGLRALVLAERAAKRLLLEERDGLTAERDALNAANEKLHHIIAVLRRARFGRKSERLSEDQLALVLEELETGSAKAEAEDEKKGEGQKRARAKKRRANRGALPSHLQRIEQIIEPETTLCPCCGKAMPVIGEERSERLDKIPAVFRVIVTRRSKYASFEKRVGNGVARKGAFLCSAGAIPPPRPMRETGSHAQELSRMAAL